MILYFDCSTQLASSTEPDTSGKQVVDFPLPSVTPLVDLTNFVVAANGLANQGLPIVFRVTIAEA